MKIINLSENEAKDYIADVPYIHISIRSPKTESITLPENLLRLANLFLAFHDIDERCLEITDRVDCDVCGGSGFIPEYRHIENGRCFKCNKEGLNLQLFGRKDAIHILEFVEKYIDDIKLIIVNCEAGVSRSAGVAGALSKILNGWDDAYFKHSLPNMLVYRTILVEYFK